MEAPGARELEVQDWGRMGYEAALTRQRGLVEERILERAPDRLVLVEHPPAVTLGRSATSADLVAPRDELERRNVSVTWVERGGRATFHGPGQLVAYPITRIRDQDVHAFLQRLLGAAAEVLEAFGLRPERKTGQPGLWVNGAKIASVGVAVRKWVTFHGIALNVNTDPAGFELIVTCGQPAEKVTSMERELGRPVPLDAVKPLFVQAFRRRFGYCLPRDDIGGCAGPRRPSWLRVRAADPGAIDGMEARLSGWGLATVCQSAHCPNLGECFSRGTATFMILGTVCTRRCRFCAVDKGLPGAPDPDEPARVARAAGALGLRYAVVTSVTRDDLADGGAAQFAGVVGALRHECPAIRVEVLVPDFNGSAEALDLVCDASPDMFNHNVETVPRLYPLVRPGADYRRSLGLIAGAARRGLPAKSGLMLGLGETSREIWETLYDLRKAGCGYLTLGQYLAPSPDHLAVARYVAPEEFGRWQRTARAMGFLEVAAGPLVRSSYRAEAMFERPGRSNCGCANSPGHAKKEDREHASDQ
ncbi:MAG: lipoyl synthase [bacterium]